MRKERHIYERFSTYGISNQIDDDDVLGIAVVTEGDRGGKRTDVARREHDANDATRQRAKSATREALAGLVVLDRHDAARSAVRQRKHCVDLREIAQLDVARIALAGQTVFETQKALYVARQNARATSTNDQ